MAEADEAPRANDLKAGPVVTHPPDRRPGGLFKVRCGENATVPRAPALGTVFVCARGPPAGGTRRPSGCRLFPPPPARYDAGPPAATTSAAPRRRGKERHVRRAARPRTAGAISTP